MNEKHTPRFLIAAASSGSGKTLITCGILQALIQREKKVALMFQTTSPLLCGEMKTSRRL